MKIKEFFSYLCVKNAAEAIRFYETVFGAKEKFRLAEANGRIGHAELDFGCSTLMISDEFPDWGIAGPKQPAGAKSFQIHLHVDNADECIARAVKLGAEVVFETQDQFYGERSGTIRDPFGHYWNIGHHIEDVSTEEMQRRYEKMMESSQK